MTTEELRFVLKAKDEASRELRNVKNEMGGVSKAVGGFGKVAGIAATVGIAALAAGMTALITLGINAKHTYEKWMQTLDDFQDVSGLSAKSVSLIAAQARLADVDVNSLSRGIFIFTRNLHAARKGGGQAAVFKELGVHLKNADGSLRPLNDVLLEARDRLSEVEDQTTRNGLAAQLFGRGAKDMADWLDKSAKKMREYKKFTEDLGMVIGEKSMKHFQDYAENQRKMAFAWDAVKINAYGALVPLINDLMPDIINGMTVAADWTGRFRKLVEKKGWEAAVKEMAPWVWSVIEGLKKARKWWGLNSEDIKDIAVAIIYVVGKVVAFGGAVAKTAIAIKAQFVSVKNAIVDQFVGAYISVVAWINKLVGKINWLLGKIGMDKIPLLTSGTAPSNNYAGSGGKGKTGDSILGTGKKAGAGGGIMGDLWGMLSGVLPEAPILPPVMAGVPKYIIERVKRYVKSLMGGSGKGLGGIPGGAGYAWAYALAKRFGLSVTSTFRPGAITASGNMSNHGIYGKAADFAGPASRMMALANALFSSPSGFAEIIYQHRGYKAGTGGYYFPRTDHYSHVHVARGDSIGGTGSRPAPAMAVAGSSAPINLYGDIVFPGVDPDEFLDWLRSKGVRMARGI